MATPSPNWPFQLICADYFEQNNHSYLAIVDQFSGWLNIYHFKPGCSINNTLISTCRSLSIACGAPEEISTDGDPQFMSNEFQTFLHQWGVRHRRSSASYPQSNGRAELGVKAAKRLIIDNTKSDGSLDNNKAAQAIMQYRNTPLLDINLSPAQILFHRQLHDHILANLVHYKLHEDWIMSANQREKALAQRNENIAKKYNVSTRQLLEVRIGTTVAIQEPNSKGYRCWVTTGIVVEILPHCQYHVHLDGSNRITLRNRRFIKHITPNLTNERQIFISPLANPEKVSEPPVSEMPFPAPAQPIVPAEPEIINHQLKPP